MAVVFISPKQRQRTFFMIITAVFVLFLIIVSSGVFLSEPKDVSSNLVFNKPKVNIDMGVFESDKFKSLEKFNEMENQYSYRASDKKNKQEVGFISAVSADEAKKELESRGLVVIDLRQVELGRTNPFVPYYEIAPVVPKVTKKTSF